jgi:hypothetical protein
MLTDLSPVWPRRPWVVGSIGPELQNAGQQPYEGSIRAGYGIRHTGLHL